MLDDICQKLAALQTLEGAPPRSPEPLPEPLSEERVAALELVHGVTLPAEYRAFVMRVGDGVPGPLEGLLPLQEALDQTPSLETLFDWWNFEAVPSSVWDFDRAPELQRPFPLTSHLDLAPGERAHTHDGCLVLCRQWSGTFYALVVTGRGAGTVWVDSTYEQLVLDHEKRFESTGLDFLTWYEAWLDRELRGWMGMLAWRATYRAEREPLALLARLLPLLESAALGEDRRARVDLGLAHLALGRPDDARAIWDALARDGAVTPYGAGMRSDCPALHRSRSSKETDALDVLGGALFAEQLRAAAAQPPLAPEQLAAHPYDVVRWQLAQNPTTPSHALARLTGDACADVREALAASPAIDEATLRDLVALESLRADGPDAVDAYSVLERAARSPRCGRELRERLLRFAASAGHELAELVVVSVVCNPDASPAELSHFASSPLPWVRRAVALNPSASPELLATLGADAHEHVRIAVAAHRATPPATLAELSIDASIRVRMQVAGNPSAAGETLLAMAALPPRRATDELSLEHLLRHNPSCPAEALPCLIEDREWSGYVAPKLALDAYGVEALRADIAWHPAYPPSRALRERRLESPWLPPSLRRALLQDLGTGAQVAHDSDAPVDVLVRLASDRDGVTAAAALGHPRTPVELALAAATSSYQPVRVMIARRADVPGDVLARLAEDPSVRGAVAENPAAPPALLASLAADPDRGVRRSCAENPSLPEAQRQALAADPDDRVRAAARRVARKLELARRLAGG